MWQKVFFRDKIVDNNNKTCCVIIPPLTYVQNYYLYSICTRLTIQMLDGYPSIGCCIIQKPVTESS